MYYFFIYFVFVSLQARMSKGSKLFWVWGYFEPKTVSKFRLEPKLVARALGFAHPSLQRDKNKLNKKIVHIPYA
jgi:hypothetical protein